MDLVYPEIKHRIHFDAFIKDKPNNQIGSDENTVSNQSGLDCKMIVLLLITPLNDH